MLQNLEILRKNVEAKRFSIMKQTSAEFSSLNFRKWINSDVDIPKNCKIAKVFLK